MSLTFGKYQLYERVGEGGMAIVWRAKLHGPNGFEKSLVVKQIRPELAARPEFVELFVAEAKLTVSLSHASIAQVFELGMVDGVYFLALELVDGPSLASLTRAGPVQPFVAAYVVEQVLRGLDYAHRRGVVHRDLSAANVLVSREGEVKIVDFGIAAAVDARAVRGGSAGYMAPEQEAGGRADARSDLYAVGVLLWELLAGKRYDGSVPLAPPALQKLLKQATAADPADRFADAAAMLAALSRFLRDVSYTPNPVELAALIRRRGLARATPKDDATQADDESEAQGPRTRPLPGRESDAADGSQVTFATRVPELEAGPTRTPAAAASPRRNVLAWVATAAAFIVLGYAGWRWNHERHVVMLPPDRVVPAPDPRAMPRPPTTVAIGPSPAAAAVRARGRLVVKSEPAGADLLLGTRVIGQTPFDGEVPFDRPLTVHLRSPGFVPVERVITRRDFVGAEPTATLHETLTALLPGFLTLNALPWAHVFVDGEPFGDTPIARRAVPPGAHSVRFSAPATGHDLTLSVTVAADGEQRRLVDLRGEPRLVPND